MTPQSKREKKAIENIKKWKNIFELGEVQKLETFLSKKFEYKIEIEKSKKLIPLTRSDWSLRRSWGRRKCAKR